MIEKRRGEEVFVNNRQEGSEVNEKEKRNNLLFIRLQKKRRRSQEPKATDPIINSGIELLTNHFIFIL